MCVCWVVVGRGKGREKGVRETDIGYRGGRGEVGGVRKDTKEKCACKRVCMKDWLVQSIKDIEPTIHQKTCGAKANKMAMCCPAAIYFRFVFDFKKRFGEPNIVKHCAKKQR